MHSFADCYDLYILLLDFANALTTYADEQLQERIARSQATHTSFSPNRRFIRNRFAEQLFNNQRLRHELEERHLSWEAGMSAVKAVYLNLVATPWYKEYMEQADCTYEDDKRIWRKIYTELLPSNEAVLSAIDDALEGWKVPREVLSREQEAWLAAYVRRLVKRRDKVAAKLIQISAEEDNFDAIISSFHALPEDDRTILQEMIFLGVKGANVCISRDGRTDRTVWRHRKAALERIALDCSRKRGALP